MCYIFVSTFFIYFIFLRTNNFMLVLHCAFRFMNFGFWFDNAAILHGRIVYLWTPYFLYFRTDHNLKSFNK